MIRSIDSQANIARRLAIQSGKIKPRTTEAVEFDLDRSLYEAGATPASIASRTGGWVRHAHASEPQDMALKRPIREEGTKTRESRKKKAATKKVKKQESRHLSQKRMVSGYLARDTGNQAQPTASQQLKCPDCDKPCTTIENHQRYCLGIRTNENPGRHSSANERFLLPPLETDLQFRPFPLGESFQLVFERDHIGESSASKRSWNWARTRELEEWSIGFSYCPLEKMKGYGVFFFKECNYCVLESPKEKNATYILGPDWRELASMSKADLRIYYPNSFKRILHTEEGWRRRVENALYSRWH